MTNEEIVLDRIKSKIKNRKLSALKFTPLMFQEIDSYITNLTSLESKEERIQQIVYLSSRLFGTVHYKSGSFQCKRGARRSALDIMCIYKFYFEEIELFEVMRILYKLVEERKLTTMKCPTIHKQVFWTQGSYYNNTNYTGYENSELGIHFNDWKSIGVTND